MHDERNGPRPRVVGEGEVERVSRKTIHFRVFWVSPLTFWVSPLTFLVSPLTFWASPLTFWASPLAGFPCTSKLEKSAARLFPRRRASSPMAARTWKACQRCWCVFTFPSYLSLRSHHFCKPGDQRARFMRAERSAGTAESPKRAVFEVPFLGRPSDTVWARF